MNADIKQELAALRQRIDELEAQAKAKADDSWPNNGDKYYYLASDATVGYLFFDGTKFDIDAVAVGNVYRTCEEAEREVERRKVLTELRKLAKASGKCDWADKNQCKWYLYFDNGARAWIVGNYALVQGQGTAHFATEQAAQAAIKTIGADRLMLLLED